MYKCINKFLLSLCLIVFWQVLFAQSNVDKLSPYQLKKYAERAYLYGDYHTVVSSLEQYLSLTDDNKYRFKLGEAHYQIRNYHNAADEFMHCINNNYDAGQASWYYAKCMKRTGNYQEAINYFKLCLNKGSIKSYPSNCMLEINACELALDSIQNYRPIEINNMGAQINSKHLDSNPIYLDEQTLLYVSYEQDTLIKYALSKERQIPLPKLILARKSGANWYKTSEELISLPEHKNISSASLSHDGKRFYFTICERDWKNKEVCQIYMSRKVDNKWHTAEKLNDKINLSAYTNTHLTTGSSYNPNLEILYYASDRPDGKGGMDIWYTVYNKKRNTFIEPRNCGAKINTSGNEISPFIFEASKSLYFSSDGHYGYGGYDVFASVGELAKWSKPEVLEYPLNTNADEVFYTLNPSHKDGFLVSNRIGAQSYSGPYCCYDMYTFNYPKEILPVIKGKLSISFFEAISKYLSKGISLRKEDSTAFFAKYFAQTKAKLYITDDEQRVLIQEKSLDHKGAYNFVVDGGHNYLIELEKQDYVIGSSSMEIPKHQTDSTILEVPLFEREVIPEAPLEISNIYYEFNQSELSENAEKSLDETLIPLLKELPQISIELWSHTDSVGVDSYNMRLSQQRANKVMYYLINQGISRRRVKAKGFGESVPIAPNSKPDGTDNPEGRKKNRRTEISIKQ